MTTPRSITVGNLNRHSVTSGAVKFLWTFTEEGEWGTAHSMPLRPGAGEEESGQAWAYVEFRYNTEDDDDLEEWVEGDWIFSTFDDRSGKDTKVEMFKGTWGDREEALAIGSRLAVEWLMARLEEQGR